RRRLGALLPRAHRPGPAARRPGAARARAGARAALALPPPAALALPRQADLRPALPPDRGAVGARARRAALGAADDADERDVARLPVGERLLLRLARGRGPRLRLPADLRRQRPRAVVQRALHERAPLPRLPRPVVAARRLRRLRVQGPLRRLPRPRLRGDRGPVRGGAGLRLRARRQPRGRLTPPLRGGEEVSRIPSGARTRPSRSPAASSRAARPPRRRPRRARARARRGRRRRPGRSPAPSSLFETRRRPPRVTERHSNRMAPAPSRRVR